MAMNSHGVKIERQAGLANIEFASRFNVAIPFIDRHLSEGRGAKIAIYTARGERVSYATLSE
ncbi:MAG TPA: hypothetical protein VFX76_05620, partial [Roseiflexaceae bacterium]|nr:hypothetical protein [Roseiflexaceae bacterium]